MRMIVCTLLILLGLQCAAQAQPKTCESEARGCYTIEVFAVEDSNHPLLMAVKSGEKRIHEVATQVWAAVQKGEIRASSVAVTAYLFDINSTALQSASVYDNREGGFRKKREAIPLRAEEIPPLAQGLPLLGKAYQFHAVGKPAMLALPLQAFTASSSVLLCAPNNITVLPSSERQEGIWIPKEALTWYREHGHTWGMTFMIVAPMKTT